MHRRIGFIGLGAMGGAMAETLVKKQYRVTGYDNRPEAVARLDSHGGKGAASAEEAARDADMLILMVVNADQAENALFDNLALEASKPSAIVVLCSTCAPDRVVSIAHRVERSGRRFVDAPVSGGVTGAAHGTLTIMAAARKPVFDDAKPVLAAMGSSLFHLGEHPGQGAAMKVVNQLLCGIHIAAAAEGLAFAERAGIDPKIALEVLSGSAAQSWMLKARGPKMVDYDNLVTSAVDIFVKDLGLVLDSGRAAKMGLPLAAAAHQLFLSASGMGHGHEDDSQVIETYRALMRKKE
ncbi:MAG: NAD(P)-dependent oxidoreductase [Hyphomicrobiaceae bacterium]|nr:NAD(P)-dependent oxidoreductase [Hyphomicrobiaceae bacterium]